MSRRAIWGETGRGTDSMLCLQGILAALVLLVAPLATLLAEGCCMQPGCCSKGYCPLPAAHHSQEFSRDKVHSYLHSAAADDCRMKAACGHSTQAKIVFPLPPAILQVAAWFWVGQASRCGFDTVSRAVLAGFHPLPFEPPRS